MKQSDVGPNTTALRPFASPLRSKQSSAAGMRRLTLGLCALLFGAALLTGCAPETFERVVVQRDLLEDLSTWQVRGGPPNARAHLGTLTPSYSALYDAGDLPSILFPASTTLSYTFPATDGPALLRCAGGVDLSVPRSLKPNAKPLRVRFTARLDGATVLDLVVPVHPTEDSRRSAKTPQVWHWLGGADGLPVRGGQTLELRYEVQGATRGPGSWKIGFGSLIAETTIPTPRTTASVEEPNLVLVVVDTERADRTSTHGYDRPTTPHLDALAARGVSFDNAWAPAPWTWPSTASLLTGLEPLAHGVTSHEACYLGHDVPTLPKLLQERGFTTGGFSANPLICADKNFDAGFEHFESTKDFAPGSEILPHALQWLRDNHEHRFFLYLHLVDPHDPHRPLPAELKRLGGSPPADFPKGGYRTLGGRLRKRVVELGEGGYDVREHVTPRQRQWVKDAYDACVATADVHLGTLVAQLAELGLQENTVIAYTSDHGEELFDHGLTNHAHSLHPELLHVPLVIAGPGFRAGVRHESNNSNRHLATTLALLAGGDLGVPDGISLQGYFPRPEHTLFFHTTKGIWNDWSMVEIFGVHEWPYALHWAPEGRPFRTLPSVDPGLGQWRLYDHSADPKEHVDVAAQYPREVERLRGKIETWRAAARTRSNAFGAGAGTRNLLEGVGYIEVGTEEDE